MFILVFVKGGLFVFCFFLVKWSEFRNDFIIEFVYNEINFLFLFEDCILFIL